jgi:hypothetical protein
MSNPEFKTGQYIRIDWSDGSIIQGRVVMEKNDLITLVVGPGEPPEAYRMILGTSKMLTQFVEAGTIQVVDQGDAT